MPDLQTFFIKTFLVQIIRATLIHDKLCRLMSIDAREKALNAELFSGAALFLALCGAFGSALNLMS